MTRVDQTRVYMTFCVDFRNFSTRWGGSTRVSKQVTRQDGLTQVTCKQLKTFEWRRVDPG